MNMEGYTAKEIADILGINLKAAKLRIFRQGIKPVTKDALYDKSVLEILRNTPGRGRPRKPSNEPGPPSE
jgi:predicted ArsR family transcriptional regulator